MIFSVKHTIANTQLTVLFLTRFQWCPWLGWVQSRLELNFFTYISLRSSISSQVKLEFDLEPQNISYIQYSTTKILQKSVLSNLDTLKPIKKLIWGAQIIGGHVPSPKHPDFSGKDPQVQKFAHIRLLSSKSTSPFETI